MSGGLLRLPRVDELDARKRRQTCVDNLSSRLSEHLSKIEEINEQRRDNDANISRSDQKRRSQAMYRTTGEQVGHIMFGRRSSVKPNDLAGPRRGPNIEDARSEGLALGRVDGLDAKNLQANYESEYFLSRQEAENKATVIRRTI